MLYQGLAGAWGSAVTQHRSKMRNNISLVDEGQYREFAESRCAIADTRPGTLRPYAMKGPPTILSGTLTSNSARQLTQDMYWWCSFLATPERRPTWIFCLTLQCGHSTVISLAVNPAMRSKVGIKSVPAADLDTNPCPHSFIPALNTGVSWTVKNTILVEGAIRRIS